MTFVINPCLEFYTQSLSFGPTEHMQFPTAVLPFLVGAFYQNEPDYYSGKFFFFFFRQTTECMRSGHFLQNY